jgi:hypothetical protein
MAGLPVEKTDCALTLDCDGPRRRWHIFSTPSVGAPFCVATPDSRRSLLGDPIFHRSRGLVRGGCSFLVVEVPEVWASVYRLLRCRCVSAKEMLLLRSPYQKRSYPHRTLTRVKSAMARFR